MLLPALYVYYFTGLIKHICLSVCCYGNYNNATIKFERDGKIGKIATHC